MAFGRLLTETFNPQMGGGYWDDEELQAEIRMSFEGFMQALSQFTCDRDAKLQAEIRISFEGFMQVVSQFTGGRGALLSGGSPRQYIGDIPFDVIPSPEVNPHIPRPGPNMTKVQILAETAKTVWNTLVVGAGAPTHSPVPEWATEIIITDTPCMIRGGVSRTFTYR